MNKTALDDQITVLLGEGEDSDIHKIGARGNVQETTRAYNDILEFLNRARRDNQLGTTLSSNITQCTYTVI